MSRRFIEVCSSCARMTHVGNFFSPKIATVPQSQVYLSITQAKQMRNLLLR